MDKYKKCVVLGSNSFAGSWFVFGALERGMEVVGISRSKEPHDIFLPYKKSENIQKFSYKQMDINHDVNMIVETIKEFEPEIIVDFAGQGMVSPSWDWPEQWYQTNIVAKAKIQNILRKMSFLKRYIRISTPEVYGHTEGPISEHTRYNPTTPYAVSHASIDMHLKSYHKQYDFPVVFVRFANFYGPGQQPYRIVPRATFCALTKERLPLDGGGTSTRAFIHGQDVMDGIFQAIYRGKVGEIYHFSTDEFVTIKELVEKISDQAGTKMEDFVDMAPERLGKDSAYFMDASKAKRELDWIPKYSLDLGLRETHQWVRDNLDTIREMPKRYIHKK